MFLSLVRPDRISSPMTRIAAVTIELMAFPFRVARYTASRNRHGKRLMNDVHPAASYRPIAFAPAPVTRTRGADTGPFTKALAALDLPDAEIVASRNGANLDNVTPFDDLARTHVGPAVDKTVAAAGHDTIAKILFTSGSTGLPKGVVNTHGML